MFRLLAVLLLGSALRAANGATWTPFDNGWRFHRGGDNNNLPSCTFPNDMGGRRCMGLRRAAEASTPDECSKACCSAGESCQTWQWCPKGAPCAAEATSDSVSVQGCWIGAMRGECSDDHTGWLSKSRDGQPSPSPGSGCTESFCHPSFDDSKWRTVETPHDWAIEDLPSRSQDMEFPVLEVRNGTWLFQEGDNATWSDAGFDDSNWKEVIVPHDWRDPPTSVTGTGVIGWYRRHLNSVTQAQINAAEVGDLKLALGTVASVGEVYLNGHLVGATGSIDHESTGCESYLRYNSFVVPSGLLVKGTNVVAVRVRNGDNNEPGGMYDSMAGDMRSGPFDPASSPGQKQTGYTVAGIGWYRKQFASPTHSGRTVIRFDGVYMHADIYLNDKLVASHPYGYTTFEVDITGMLMLNDNNVLAVRVASMGSNSRWYAGAGIFRHVHLITTPLVHALTFGGVSVVAEQDGIDLAARTATLNVTTSIRNSGTSVASTTVLCMLTNAMSNEVKNLVTIGVGETVNVSQSIPLSNVNFWSPDTPYLYTAVVQINVGSVTDSVNATFGVRHISFDSTNGFQLNGVSTKLKGGCVHHDNGPLGSKTIDRAEERRVEILKANGYNAIRTSHNPVSPAFVAACDRLGVMLMEEAFDCWDDGKNSDDYHLYFDEWWQRDIASMVLRDRNSPSIIMWSIGNEIPMRRSPQGIAFSHQLSDFIHALDPISGNGRATTSAYPGVQLDNITDAFLEPLDVAGYNYGWSKYVPSHVRVPSRVIAGTESFPMQSFDTWQGVVNNSWVIGDFIWTAIDYIGESAIGGTGYNTPSLLACGGYCPQGWSWHISFCGDIDVVGHRKPQSYYRAVLWNASQLEIAAHEPVAMGQHEVVASWGWPTELQSWSWKVNNGTNISVNIYSRHKYVGLLLNGKSLTEQPVAISQSTQFTASFTVGYEPGSLTAVGYGDDGKVSETKTLLSAGHPSRILLDPDRSSIRASRNDLSYVTAALVDSKGVLVPNADTPITFSVTGDGELASVGSGDPADIGSFQQPTRTTFRGKAVAIVRPGSPSNVPLTGGRITLTASAPGFPPTSVIITTN